MIQFERQHQRLQFFTMDTHTLQDTFAQDVAQGLTAPRKSLPAKYFYDEHGSQIYERICALPEYYLYRAERDILALYAAEIVAEIGHLPLVELGSGSAAKTRYLLTEYERAGRPFLYCPVDISRSMLQETAERLIEAYTHVTVLAMHADFTGNPEVMQALPITHKAVGCFGSSLGNLTRQESADFLQRLAATMGPEDVFLLGIDLKKSTQLLIPAYDDAQGVTAAFNLNLLRRINRELGGNFALQNFDHIALYNETHGRIEMHLRSRKAQEVTIAKTEQVVTLAAGETIHTENSYKYDIDDVRALGWQANLRLHRTWFDSQRHFLVGLFRPC